MANCRKCGRTDRDGLIELEFMPDDLRGGSFECVDDWDCDGAIESQREAYPDDFPEDTPSLDPPPWKGEFVL